MAESEFSRIKSVISSINLDIEKYFYLREISSLVNIKYDPNDFILYNNIFLSKVKLVTGFDYPIFPEYLNIKLLNYECQKWQNNLVSYSNATVKGNLYSVNHIIAKEDLIVNGISNIKQLSSQGDNVLNIVNCELNTDFHSSIYTNSIRNYNLNVNTIKFKNDKLSILQTDSATEYGFQVNDNLKQPRFVWKSTGSQGEQFYCIDKDNNILPLIFSADDISTAFVEKTGDAMRGELLLNVNPALPNHQVNKSYIDYVVFNQVSQINTHDHDAVYISKTGGELQQNVKLNLNYNINIQTDSQKYQINKKTYDDSIGIHNHDAMYVKRSGDNLIDNLEIETRQYSVLSNLTEYERLRQQTKFDVDTKQQTIASYTHTNYLQKNKPPLDPYYVDYSGQIFLKKLPRQTIEAKTDFINKLYVDILSGRNMNGLFNFSFIDINMGWTNWMYEYSFNFQPWFTNYYTNLPQDLKPTIGNIDNFIVYPIITFKTLRFANSDTQSYKGQGGEGTGSQKFVNYKSCPPYYYETVSGKKCLYKFKIRLGQFGVDPILTGNSYTQLNTTQGYVNYRIFFIGGPTPLFYEFWNKDVSLPGNMRLSSETYNAYNLLDTLFFSNENQSVFTPNFCDYTQSL